MKELLSEVLRPTEFEHLMQSDAQVKGLQRMAKNGAPLNMLFYGSPGVGKTSAARILIKKLDADAVEINASVDNGIDIIRDVKPATTSVAPWFEGGPQGPRMIFFDEADFLSKNAQAGLRGFIEGARHCRFLLTANDISKMTPALKSRCMPVCFDIPPKAAEEVIERISPRLLEKINAAGYNLTAERLRELLHFYFPDLRAVISKVDYECDYTEPPR